MPPTQALHDAQRAVAGYRSRGRRPAAVFLGAGASRTFGYRHARLLLERAILEVIADDEPFGDTDRVQLRRFCRLLTQLKAATTPRPRAVMTTNYDMAADMAAFTCAAVGKDNNGYCTGGLSRFLQQWHAA